MITNALATVAKSGLATLGSAANQTTDTTETDKLKKAAKAFEAVFVRQLLGEMRSSSFGDDLTGGSGVEQFQEMADAQTADTLSERGSFGIAGLLVKQLAPKHAAASYAAQATDAATDAATDREG
ncbi:MAG TPA: rod-binding protein [Sphingobium sp.]